LTICVDYYGITNDGDSTDGRDIRSRLRSKTYIASNADCISFARNAFIADVNIVVASKIYSRCNSDRDIVVTGKIAKHCRKTDGDVVSASSVKKQSRITNSNVFGTVRVASERFSADGRVTASVDVAVEGKRSMCRVAVATTVIGKRRGSNSRIRCAGGVEQKRCGANGGIGISVVGGKGSGTNTSAKTSVAILSERVPTQRCISNAGGELIKRVTPCPCVEIWRALLCRGNGSSGRRKGKASEGEWNEQQSERATRTVYRMS
jgi:hypothetical protein